MRDNDHSNIGILKEIAELLNEETEIVSMLKGALVKFLNGTNFETGWIFLSMKRALRAYCPCQFTRGTGV